MPLKASSISSALPISEEGAKRMMTNLVDVEDARERLASGERPYAFETSDHFTMVGPSCGYGAEYLRHLRNEGRYAEDFAEATRIADARGATVTGIWFVKPKPPKTKDL